MTGVGLYAALCAVLFFSQRSLIYFPQPRALPTDQALLTLRTQDADLLVTTRHVPSTEAVIYFGGNAEDVSRSLPELTTAFPEHALYLLHYRGYGGSSGKPSEQALHHDALVLFDKVQETHSHITVIGRSLGSGVAIRLAAMRPVARLVLVTPYYSIEELAARQFPLFPVRWLLQDKYESWRYAPEVKAPTTIIQAEHDELIPNASSTRLYSQFTKGIAEYVIIPNTDHNSVSESPVYLQALRGDRRPTKTLGE